MAQRLEYTPRVWTAEEKLAEAQADSNEALLEGLKLLRGLHETGVLETLVKLVRGGEGLLGGTLRVLEGDSSTRLTRNVLELVRTASEIDPEAVGSLGRAVNAGLIEGARRVQKGDGIGLGELLGLLKTVTCRWRWERCSAPSRGSAVPCAIRAVRPPKRRLSAGPTRNSTKAAPEGRECLDWSEAGWPAVTDAVSLCPSFSQSSA